ncbi:diacylglycerol kinase [Rubrivivax gelatinosus]|nr:diacylglycerol kinase [Rubrivivax gelatinosus]
MADSRPPPPLQRPDGSSRPSNPHKGRTGLERIRRAAGYSAAGLAAAFRGESAFRQEVFAATLMLPAAFWVGGNWVEISLLAGSVLLVLVVELLNSAIEAVVDRVGFELHELSKRAKDLGSAAVMLSLLLAGGIWIGALWQRLA